MLRGGAKIIQGGGKKKQVFFSHIKGAKNAFSYEYDPPPEQNFLNMAQKCTMYVYHSNLVFFSA